MNTIPVHYFDGRNTLPHPATLSREGDVWLIKGESVNLRLPCDLVGFPAAVGQSTRFLRLPAGARCQVTDVEAFVQLEQLASAKSSRIDKIITRLEARARLVAAATLVLVTGLVGAFYFSLPRLAAHIAGAIPATVEKRISLHTMQVLDRRVFDYSALGWQRQQELQTSFTSLLSATGYTGKPLKLILRRMADDSANAFALPDGTLILTDGLVNLAQDDDELMAVLVHEIGHCENHHAVRMLLQDSAAFVFAVSLLGDASAVTNIAGTLPLLLTSKKYSRDFETEADLYALRAMQRAEIPLHRFVDIMERMETTRKHGVPPRYISTHPPTGDRLKVFRAAYPNKP
ncbi:MAG: M48 family metallopeptidase [Nibricoccus sp.]